MLKNNNVVKVLSVLIAIVLWAYVMGEVTPTSSQTLKNIKVNIVNEEILEEAGLAVAGAANYRVSVTLEGKRSVVKKVRAGDLDVTADVQGYKRGVHYVEVKVEAPDDVKITDIKDSKIKVTIENEVSENRKVDVVLTGNSEDVELKDETVAPDTIQISGAESDVEKVKKINAPVSAKALEKGEGKAEADLVAVNEAGDEVKEVDLSSETAEVQASVMRTKTVKLKTVLRGEKKNTGTVSVDAPGKILIQGTKKDLAGIESIKTKSIDVSSLTGTNVFTLEPKAPDGIKVLTPSEKLFATITVK